MQVRWSAAETQQLRDLVSVHGRHWDKIGAIMSRSAKSVQHRWFFLNSTPDERRAGRKLDLSDKKPRSYIHGHPGASVRPLDIPEEVLIERNLRVSTPRTIGAAILGDPPPGYSALDRKRAEQRA